MQAWSLGQEDPLEKKWQHTPVFLPGKSNGQKSLAGYSSWGHKRVRYDEVTKQQQIFPSSYNIFFFFWSRYQTLWPPGGGVGQEGLACCSPWGRKEPDMTEWLNCIQLYIFTSGSLLYSFSMYFNHSGAITRREIIKAVKQRPPQKSFWCNEMAPRALLLK